MRADRLCVALLTAATLNCSTVTVSEVRPAAVPDGYRWFRDDALRLAFAYPSRWLLSVDCEGTRDRCLIKLVPPYYPHDSEECRRLSPPRLTTIMVPGEPSYQVDASVCERAASGLPFPGSVYATGEKTYSSCGPPGWGDSAEACLSIGGRRVVVHMAPPAEPNDADLLGIVRSLRMVP